MRLLLLSVYLCVSVAAASDRPNIVFLMTDDQNIRSLGCYGAPNVKTPNIDRLAADGVVFDRHYDTTAICMASRATVMTGLLEYRHGVNFSKAKGGKDGLMTVEDWNNTYPMLLRKAGYRTAFAGKFGFTVDDGTQAGRYPSNDFDTWGGGKGQTSFKTSQNKSMAKYADEFPHATRSYGAFGRDFVKESVDAKKPFCLSISFKAPHRPIQPDPKFDHVYDGQTFPKPPNFGRRYGEHFSEQSRQGRQYERFESWGYATDYDAVMAKYYQLIYAVDVAVGMIREAVDEAGVADNTIVIFTSDNGYMCGAHGYGSKVLPYEESSRVPLIIFDPTRTKAADRCDAVTGSIDLASTMLAAAGVESDADRDGTSLLPLYTGSKSTNDAIVPLINVWGPKEVYSLGFSAGDWKYIYWPYSGKDMTPATEIYNITNDRYELVNLAGEPAISDVQRRLEAQYDALVDDWAERAVERHGYRDLATFFRRQ